MLPHSTPPLFAWFEVTLHMLACYIVWLLVQVFEMRCSGKVHLHRIQEDVEQCIDVLELQLYAVVCFPPSPRRIKFVPHWYRPHSFERESPQRCEIEMIMLIFFCGEDGDFTREFEDR